MTALGFKRAVGWCKTKAKATFAYHPRAERMKSDSDSAVLVKRYVLPIRYLRLCIWFVCFVYIVYPCAYFKRLFLRQVEWYRGV